MTPDNSFQLRWVTGFLGFIVAWVATSDATAVTDETPPTYPRLERTNLLIYRNSKGEVLPVKSKADWQKRRATIVAAMQEVMGPLPDKEKRCPLDVKIEEEVDCGYYIRRFITYSSEPNSRVPAYLLIPKEALKVRRKFPAILCLHQTHALGQKVVVGLGKSPHDEYGVELVQRGYVCLAPPYPLLANYAPDLKALGYQSGTMKAIWDNIRGLDLLESLPFVKKGKFGTIGHSLGGHNSVYTAVFDQRIKVIVSSCGLDSFLDYYDGDPKNWQPERGWCQTRYMLKLADYRGRLADIPFDFHEMIGALAPRPVFINAPLGDTNFRWRSVDEVAMAASQIYQLYSVPKNLRVEHPDCGHDFPDAMRQIAYQLFDENLK
ncbi:MAG: alpha/beta hydrolase [Verrucomicrobia bacterium]|nr:alpha/beta hydrolase [Verrucomicrobiota bacterium]